MNDEIEVIKNILDKARDKFPEVFKNPLSDEGIIQDWDMEEWIAEQFIDCWWFAGGKNCLFVCKLGEKFFQVDYIDYNITEISVEEFDEICTDTGRPTMNNTQKKMSIYALIERIKEKGIPPG